MLSLGDGRADQADSLGVLAEYLRILERQQAEILGQQERIGGRVTYLNREEALARRENAS